MKELTNGDGKPASISPILPTSIVKHRYLNASTFPPSGKKKTDQEIPLPPDVLPNGLVTKGLSEVEETLEFPNLQPSLPERLPE